MRLPRKGLELLYRRGYYAVDTAQRLAPASPRQKGTKRQYYELQAALADPLPATQVTFRMHLPPAVGDIVQIQLLVDAQTLAFKELPGGLPSTQIWLLIFALSRDGKLIQVRGTPWILDCARNNTPASGRMACPSQRSFDWCPEVVTSAWPFATTAPALWAHCVCHCL